MHKNEEQMSMSGSERETFALLRLKTLSGEEKRAMWKELQVSIQEVKVIDVLQREPRAVKILSLFTNRSFAMSAFSIALVLGSSFGVARAAESSLPGQALYPVKINVNEPIIGSLKLSDGAKIAWEQELASRRITEAETLAEEGKLGTVEKVEIEQQLSQNRRTIEKIKGHDITDDEFFPQQIAGETQKVNVSVDHSKNENIVHIEERLENGSDEVKEKASSVVDAEEHDTSFGGYTKGGAKIKNEKKREMKSTSNSQTDKQLSKEGNQKTSSSEKSDSSSKQNTEQKNTQGN